MVLIKPLWGKVREMKKLFEEWAVTHFGEHIREKFESYDEEDGYAEPLINAMWIGFNGYKILSEQ